MKNIFILTLLIALVSCSGGAKKNQATDVSADNVEVSDDIQIFDDGHYAENSLDYWGVYKGKLPSAGSPIELTLTLNKEGTFNIKELHSDSDSSFENTDKEEVEYYFIGENTATLLTPDKEFYEGELASQYVLTKVE